MGRRGVDFLREENQAGATRPEGSEDYRKSERAAFSHVGFMSSMTQHGQPCL